MWEGKTIIPVILQQWQCINTGTRVAAVVGTRTLLQPGGPNTDFNLPLCSVIQATFHVRSPGTVAYSTNSQSFLVCKRTSGGNREAKRWASWYLCS